MSDWQLLSEYLEKGNEEAFGQLVSRHLNFVYCAAVRQTSNPQMAQEVAQAVFVLMARKAAEFDCKVILPATGAKRSPQVWRHHRCSWRRAGKRPQPYTSTASTLSPATRFVARTPATANSTGQVALATAFNCGGDG